MDKREIDQTMPAADERIHITVTEQGPYLVYGRPPLAQQFIMPDADGESWYFQEGMHLSTEEEPTALCRCGASRRKPYCDGSHASAVWNPELTAPPAPRRGETEWSEGEGISMSDHPRYCTFARFCEAKGQAWQLVAQSADPDARRLAIREASMCPGGRLTVWNNATGNPYEFRFEPSLGLIEDPDLGVSGGLWVRGGIGVSKQSGESYEVRNRMVLCRCGASRNKPFCDGGHAAQRFDDGLEGVPEGETLPEAVY